MTQTQVRCPYMLQYTYDYDNMMTEEKVYCIVLFHYSFQVQRFSKDVRTQ